jgi:hypothetical protein
MARDIGEKLNPLAGTARKAVRACAQIQTPTFARERFSRLFAESSPNPAECAHVSAQAGLNALVHAIENALLC